MGKDGIVRPVMIHVMDFESKEAGDRAAKADAEDHPGTRVSLLRCMRTYLCSVQKIKKVQSV